MVLRAARLPAGLDSARGARQGAHRSAVAAEPAAGGFGRRGGREPDRLDRDRPHPITGPGDLYQGTLPVSGRVTAIAPDPSSSDVAYLGGAAGGVWKTVDGGANWTPTDGGTTWTRKVTGIPISVAVSPATPSVWYASFYFGAIFKSSDSGQTWVQLAGGLPTADLGRTFVAAAPSDAQRLYAVFGRYSSGGVYGIYTSADAGTTWSPVSAGVDPSFCDLGGGGQCWYDLALAVAPTDAGTFYAAGIKLFKYTGSGSGRACVAYGPSGIHVDFHALAFDSAADSGSATTAAPTASLPTAW